MTLNDLNRTTVNAKNRNRARSLGFSPVLCGTFAIVTDTLDATLFVYVLVYLTNPIDCRHNQRTTQSLLKRIHCSWLTIGDVTHNIAFPGVRKSVLLDTELTLT